MTDMADIVIDQDGSIARVRVTGRLTLAGLGNVADRLDALALSPAQIDLSGVERMDTVGAWVIQRFVERTGAKIVGAHPDAQRLIALVHATERDVRVRHEPPFAPLRVINEIGEAAILAWQTLLGLVAFFGSVVIASWDLIRSPRRIRVNAVVHRFELVGVKALGIIGLMSFLIGIVIAQQGAVQLQQFGAEVLTVNLIGRITTRELGVLMTAIMVAGRSGSAFAAQLGTMKLTEEIDAMRTIGVSPMEALVLPRMLASIIMMPLLGFYATLISIIGGGLFCWISLEIPPVTFVQRLQEVIPLTDLWVGLLKAPVFGGIIAMTGCFQGLQVSGNAEEVGLKTTAAVVQAIFLVIVLDAFFAVFFTQIGWI
ncbi:MAG: ABC transporter permease [Alphaproteobacteria bacterium]|nr:ABC transporter permease [Alphaproteobacteria bacterium]